MEKPLFTLAAISDLHVGRRNIKKDIFARVNSEADVLVVAGDMGDGSEKETLEFLDLIKDVRKPIAVVLGNNDCDSGSVEKIKDLASGNQSVSVLDGEYVVFQFGGYVLGIAGVKGFWGGFAPHKVAMRGEAITKAVAREEIAEAEKLKMALKKMQTEKPDFSVAVTHWAPFSETVVGEDCELSIILGSSLLGDAIEEFPPSLSISGHAHKGARGLKMGRGKIPACNVGYDVNGEKPVYFDFFVDGKVTMRKSLSF